MSIVVASNASLLARYQSQFEAAGLTIASLFGTVALETAYRAGAAWLDELLVYLQENVRYAEAFDLVAAGHAGKIVLLPQEE
jgi:cystathionine beta-lyase